MACVIDRPERKPLVRRDAGGNESTATSWESLSERLIREAQESGAFDDLPHQGQALSIEDDVYAGDMALANQVLRNAGVAPAWIEADKQVRRTRGEIEALFERAARSPTAARRRLASQLQRLVDHHNDAVLRLAGIAPSAQQHRRRLDHTELSGRLDAALATAPGRDEIVP